MLASKFVVVGVDTGDDVSVVVGVDVGVEVAVEEGVATSMHSIRVALLFVGSC